MTENGVYGKLQCISSMQSLLGQDCMEQDELSWDFANDSDGIWIPAREI